ncbi:hypothetical protein V2G26_018200 [Clonostachys chloroleuca]
MEPIAIIGTSFKLPQSIDDDLALWDLLENARNVMTPWPESRLNLDAFYNPDQSKPNSLYARGGHFMSEDLATFDAPFFSITAKEAAAMDVQQRWLLETSYRAMENAGIPAEKIAGTQTGVFAASVADDYFRMIVKDPEDAPVTSATGMNPSVLANRLSWYFDLKGPSIQMNTACSTSLITLDVACQSLRSGQSSMALVTGSNVLLNVECSLHLSSMNFLSPDSVCYSFDHRANGYGRGEGFVVMLLKRLSDAIRDGDMIRAVIRGTGQNQDGHTPSLSQPNGLAQESLIKRVYEDCNLDFGLTHYVEAHGTGTQIGDQTELTALGKVFRASHSSKKPLYVGSIKSNIGHLEGGSGLAGILKCISILEKGIIPPSANFEKLNPQINARRLHVEIPTACIQWPVPGIRRVSANSFGFGGSNGHVILDDAYHTLEILSLAGIHNTLLPVVDASNRSLTTNGKHHLNGDTAFWTPTGDVVLDRAEKLEEDLVSHSDRRPTGIRPYACHGTAPKSSEDVATPKLLVWSTKDEASLKRMVQNYENHYIKSIANKHSKLNSLAYTLASRRSIMAWKTFTVVEPDSSSLPAVGKLVRSSRRPGLALIFTGQGAQYHGMGLELMQYTIFRQSLMRSCEIFRSLGADWLLLDELKNHSTINSPQFSQPLCTALQLALIDLLRSFGVVPLAVVGHSSGEIAAAYTASALTFENACKIAYHRGRLAALLIAAATEPGAMMSVNLPEGNVSGYLRGLDKCLDISIACINSPANVTLSGAEKDIDLLKEKLDKDRIFVKKVKTGIAYHSPAMQKIADEYLGALGNLGEPPSQQSEVLMVSSVTGAKLTPKKACQAQYWVDNLVSPVQFVDALSYLVLAAPKTDGLKEITDFLEVGPHGALRRPLKDTISQVSGKTGFNYVSLLSRYDKPIKNVLTACGVLFSSGHTINVAAVNQNETEKEHQEFLIDTPEYPFEHSQAYWHESRLNRDWRLRGAPEATLLGKRASDWNQLRPRWRNFLSIEDIPWAADHVIEESIFFPGTGTIMMTLEAVKQMAQEKKTISGFLIKEATFINPVVLKPESRTEVETHLRPLQQSYEKSSSRFECQVFARSGDSWIECLHTVIHVEYKEAPVEFNDKSAREIQRQHLLQEFDQAKDACRKAVPSDKFYKWHYDQGLKYGPAFSLAEEICWDGDRLGMATVNVASSVEPFDGIVHPAVLDAVCQVCFTAPSKGMTKGLPTIIPHKVEDAWISATGWTHTQTRKIRMLTRWTVNETTRGIHSSFVALSDDSMPLWRMRHLEMLPVGRGDIQSCSERNLLHSLSWKPQLSLLSPHQLKDYCNANIRHEDTTDSGPTRVQDAIEAFLKQNMEQLHSIEATISQPHMTKYIQWLSNHINNQADQKKEDVSATDPILELQKLQADNSLWVLLYVVATNLISLVNGDIDVSEHLSLAQSFYRELVSQAYDQRMVNFLQLAAHQTPKYTFTDCSANPNEAQERFGKEDDRLTYKMLDLSTSIVAQGFEANAYDIVIVSGILEGTKNYTSAVRNIREVLKSGGHVIFHDVFDPDNIPLFFSLGVMSDWWEAEEKSRSSRPKMTAMEWNLLLQAEGFSGNDLVIEDSAHMTCFFISTAIPGFTLPTASSGLMLIIDDENEFQSQLASQLASLIYTTLEIATDTVSMRNLNKATISTADYVVFLADIDASLLAELPGFSFTTIQSLIQNSKNLFWPTTCLSQVDPKAPYNGLKDGFLRTMRAEFSTKRIVSVTLEGFEMHNPPLCALHILRVFQHAFAGSSADLEYLVQGDHILTARLVQLVETNHQLNSSLHPATEVEPWLPGPPLKLDIGTRGALDTLHFVEDFEFYRPLGPTEVEIEAKTWGVSFRDMFLALGRLDDEEFGIDSAGVVTKVGPECVKFKPGDRVYMCNPGIMRMYPRAEESATVLIPETVSFEDACSALTPLLTAWYSLIYRGGLEEGEKVLIHAASGGTGQLAVQVAQMVGAEVFATVGFEHKKQLLMDVYGIPADHIFYSRNTSFAEGIMRLTNSYGVDVVLNCIAGEGLRASWELVAPYGRFIEIGKADINGNSSLPMACFSRNVSFFGVDLRHLSLYKKGTERKLLAKGMDLIRQGKVHGPKPLRIYELHDTEDAIRSFQSGKNAGRVLINVDPSSSVSKCILRQRDWKFNRNATYLISGGLGGLGRAIIRWMVSKGAKSFIVPSRSGLVSSVASAFVNEVTESGVTITTPTCDVSSAESLSQVLEECSGMPPVRGCFNASMVLNDSVFDNMTHDQWNRTLRSKVQTSWNLHMILPKDLDFFILLSSISGIIGNISQSNYAAGCTFQDALANFRKSQGLRALSIDLGAMRTVGVIAETKVLQKNFEESLSFAKIEEEELLGILNIYCDPTSTPDSSQVTVGINTPVDVLSQGREPPESMLRPLYAYYSQSRGLVHSSGSSDAKNFGALFRQAKTVEGRASVVVEALTKRLARALSMQPEDIDPNLPVHAYGVDSLVAVELRNWLGKEFISDVPVYEILSGKTITAIGQVVEALSKILLED